MLSLIFVDRCFLSKSSFAFLNERLRWVKALNWFVSTICKKASAPPAYWSNTAMNLLLMPPIIETESSRPYELFWQKFRSSTKLWGKAWKSTRSCCSLLSTWKSCSEQESWYKKRGSESSVRSIVRVCWDELEVWACSDILMPSYWLKSSLPFARILTWT